MTTSESRWLFGTASFLNFSVAGALLFLRPSLAPLLGLDPIAGTNLVFMNLLIGFIALFGYAYLRLAVDPFTYRSYIPLSIVGKLIAVASAVGPWLSGAVSWTLPALLSADGVYAMLFLRFLLRMPPRP